MVVLDEGREGEAKEGGLGGEEMTGSRVGCGG